jgi:rubrerythrin
MPEFTTPFSGLACERKLTREELVRAIRFSMAAEFEAIQLYMQLAESIDDEIAKRVLKDVADEERVHAGEFLRLLNLLDPVEERFYAEGAAEVEEMMKQVGEKQTQKDEKSKAEEGLPYCTSAPDPEHSRAANENEPCYDATQGDWEKK